MSSTWQRSCQNLLTVSFCDARNIVSRKDIPCLGGMVCQGFHQEFFSSLLN